MSQHTNHIAELRAITHVVSLTEEALDNIETQNQIIENQKSTTNSEESSESEDSSLMPLSLDKIETEIAVIKDYNELLVELDENINLLRSFDTTSQLVRNSLVMLEQVNTLMQSRNGFISELENHESAVAVNLYAENMPSTENHEPQEEGAVGGCPTGVHDRTESAVVSVAAGTIFGGILGSIAGPLGALGGAAVGGAVGRLVNESGIMETNSCDTQNSNSDSSSHTPSHEDLPIHFGSHFEL